MNHLKHLLHFTIDSCVNRMIRIGITPNFISTISFELNIFSAVLFCIAAFLERETAMDLICLGGGVILFSNLLVIIYKEAIQKDHESNLFSKLYTSVLGCYSELLVTFAIFLCLIFHGYFIASILSFMALIGSIMDSFVQEMIRGLGVSLKRGLIRRSTRNFIISIGAIMCSWFKESMSFDGMILLATAMTIIAVFSNIGVIVHIYSCRKVHAYSRLELPMSKQQLNK